MKTITLIPLTTGTGIGHFISSFAMIEKSKMAILDFDFNSIVYEVLNGERNFHNDNSNKPTVKYSTTRFNNLLFSNAYEHVAIKKIYETLKTDQIKDSSTLANIKYRIVNYPYRHKDYSLYEIIATSSYVVFFGDYTFDTKLALKEILEKCSYNRFGILLTKTEGVNFSLENFSQEVGVNQTKVFGEIPYNLKFQLATIQKKVLLEYGDNYLSDLIIKVWDNIKSEANIIKELED
ncbi:hypothetical protein [Carboxylicivirga sp. N1Y90]|uniref:hypothetical protein n=1 Tax=Carboxylicivirga fragile TaxID=3417571 RepID=UPI003D32762B|nr:hypothetical protein [Marinilabiliaceae bacterium N1Y90]